MRGVLFDFGGTIDTNGVHWSEKFWEYYQRFRIPVTKPEYEKVFVSSEGRLALDPELQTATMRDTLRKQFTLQFEMLGVRLADNRAREIADLCYSDIRSIVAEAKTILDELTPSYKLGVVSNFYGNLEIVCKEFNLDDCFNTMVDSGVVGIRKPDPGIFALALKNLDIAPSNAFVVGDSYERDIVPAKQLGCKTIWLKGKSWVQPASVEAADYTITKFEEVRKILL